MKQDEKKEWSGYYYITTFRQDGKVYAQQNSYPEEAAAQAVKEHKGAMTFFWCQGDSGIVSDLYNHHGVVVKHGGRKGQPHTASYEPVSMPADVAANLTEML